ncbi:uncharacterized protein G2W53_027334 [Senna tora]|uniref:Uncharacterized protein n=1 Tax=Senna tora TaxID=362788 RepID=A0A834TQN6_9FABA|nr:uncharacterized protein G2W53_027334 [Senna tora]
MARIEALGLDYIKNPKPKNFSMATSIVCCAVGLLMLSSSIQLISPSKPLLS